MERRGFIGSLVASALVSDSWKTWPHLARGLNCTQVYPNNLQRCVAGIDSRILGVAGLHTQRASEWCWAACIEGVFDYYGHPVTQERIVQDAYGGIVNLAGTPSAIMSSLNRSWIDDNDAPFTVQADAVDVTPAIAAQALVNDQPLIIGTTGHAMILTALTYDRDLYGNGSVIQAIVRDPWPYNPRQRALSGAEWFNIDFATLIQVT